MTAARRITLSVALMAGAATLHAQQPLFRVGVEVVRLDVSVTRDRQPVTGLGLADFEVRDNGKRQRLTGILREEVPLDVYFVFDASGSVEGEKLGHLRRAAHAFLGGLAPGDQAGLLVFSHQVSRLLPLTADVGAVRRAVDGIEPAGQTALDDGLYAALLQRRPNERRAVAVVFSDGMENMSWLTDDVVVEAARRFDVVVYGVTLTPEPDAETLLTGPGRYSASEVLPPKENELLRQVATTTAGRLWTAGSSAKLEEMFVGVLREIRSRYLLTYEPEPAGRPGWHTVQVKVKGGRNIVTSRPGYYAR
jgi:VWFA-related protein